MWTRLKQLLREWFGPKEELKQNLQQAYHRDGNVIHANFGDYAQNQQQLDTIEKQLRSGERPRGAA